MNYFFWASRNLYWLLHFSNLVLHVLRINEKVNPVIISTGNDRLGH